MINRPFIYSALATVIIFSGNTIAEDQQPDYGSPLITKQERLEHFEKMNNAKTASERKKIQQEHHQLMQKRAEARGQKQREMPKGKKDQQPVYGSPLITQQESLEHFEKMNNAKTASERQKLQQEHHQLMQKRAEARGQKQREMPKGKKDQQPVYGSPLITQQESLEHHEKMKNAKTASERQKLQQEHHQLMQKRSEARRQEHREMSKKQYESSASGNQTGTGMGAGSSAGK